MNDDKDSFEVRFSTGRNFFGESSLGSPFQVHAPGKYLKEDMHVWDYTVAAGDELADAWRIADFENNNYRINVYGPNGFFRGFRGSADDPFVEAICRYQTDPKRSDKATGNLVIQITNRSQQSQTIEIADKSYKMAKRVQQLGADRTKNSTAIIVFNLDSSHRWYDLELKIKGNVSFERRYAGRVETGLPGKTDPAMGGVI